MRRLWSDEEIALLCEFYPHFHTSKVAQAVGRTVGQCYQKAASLGLLKTERYLASDDACRVSASRRTPAMNATQFQKGQQSWSKGLKGVVGVQDGCRATQFKAGRSATEARNYVPLNTHRVSKDGYLERKVTDDPTIAPARRWVAVHRLIWEAANGVIPASHAVAFKPGQRTAALADITLDRLELLSRAELMRRNSYHTNYPPELRQLVQLKGAINRQVNRIAKEF